MALSRSISHKQLYPTNSHLSQSCATSSAMTIACDESSTMVCRVEAAGNRGAIDHALKTGMPEVLRANDQLKRERKLGKVFLVNSCPYYAPLYICHKLAISDLACSRREQ